jgi:polyferredoxin
MSDDSKYQKEKNSDELSQKFHDKAGQISRDLSQQLLALSTGIIGAFFILAFSNPCLSFLIKVLIALSIFSFGLTILFIILAMQYDASKNYFLGHINDSTKQDVREKNEQQKIKFNKQQLLAKRNLKVFFLAGVSFSILIVLIFLFFDKQNGL